MQETTITPESVTRSLNAIATFKALQNKDGVEGLSNRQLFEAYVKALADTTPELLRAELSQDEREDLDGALEAYRGWNGNRKAVEA